MRILLIRFSSLGDVVLSTVVPRNIKLNNPSDEVDFLTKEEYAPVFYNNPDVNDIITKLSLRKKYDVIIDLHSNIRSNLYKYLFRAKGRLTYNKAAYARRIFLHAGIVSADLKKTVIERYLEPLEELGYSVVNPDPVINLKEEELESLSDLLPESEYIVIAPGAKWETKQWIEENYTSLIKRIVREMDMPVVLVGSRDDIPLAGKIKQHVGLLKKYIYDLTGRTGVRELAAVLKGARAAVTTDSAALHIAHAVGTKAAAIYGPTVKEFGFQPDSPAVAILEKNLECRPCSLHGTKKCRFGDMACMQRVEVYEVFDALKKLL